MSAREVTCLVIVCDACGSEAEVDDVPSHFESVEQARAYLTGPGEDIGDHDWIMTAAEHVCPRCRAERGCATVGHQWGDWRDVEMRGVPVVVRICWTCADSEVAPNDGADR